MTAEQIVMFLAKLLAGTGVFLVGVHLMTGNIEQLATGKIKKLFGILIVLLICAVGFTACGGESLPRPEQVGINESMNILYWNEVEGASSMQIP